MDDTSQPAQPAQQIPDDEISLLDIYEFFKEGWRTVAAATVLIGATGLGTAFALPEKFLASASIQPARVLGSDVEGINVLAEKMRSPRPVASTRPSTPPRS